MLTGPGPPDPPDPGPPALPAPEPEPPPPTVDPVDDCIFVVPAPELDLSPLSGVLMPNGSYPSANDHRACVCYIPLSRNCFLKFSATTPAFYRKKSIVQPLLQFPIVSPTNFSSKISDIGKTGLPESLASTLTDFPDPKSPVTARNSP